MSPDHDHDARDDTLAASQENEGKLRIAMWLNIAIVAVPNPLARVGPTIEGLNGKFECPL